MSTSTFTLAAGARVRVRPYFHVPEAPLRARTMRSPYFFPGTILDVGSTDGAGVTVFLDDHEYAPLWAREQAYAPTQLHALSCRCGDCDNTNYIVDPRARIAALEATAPKSAPPTDGGVTLRHDDPDPGAVVFWVAHPLRLSQIARVLAYEAEDQGIDISACDLTRDEAEAMLAAALSWRGLESMDADCAAPDPVTHVWAAQTAKRLFNRDVPTGRP